MITTVLKPLRLTCCPVKQVPRPRSVAPSARKKASGNKVEPVNDVQAQQPAVQPPAVQTPSPAKRPIPIRGISQPVSEPFATKWREGQLFPDGWEEMPLSEKLTTLYVGERGFLFWANKIAFTSVIALAVAWVLFRFIGPALGLYQLSDL